MRKRDHVFNPFAAGRRVWVRLTGFGMFGLLSAPRWAVAQDTTGAFDAATAGDLGLTWRNALEYGGWLMFVLAVMSVFVLALIIYFLAVLRQGQIAPRHLVRDILESLREGSHSNARERCDDKPCPIATITLTAMDYLRDVPNPDSGLLKEIVEAEGTRQAESIQGQTQLLLDVAVIAPMVGLLGTVFGMLKAFSGVGYAIESAKPVVLAQGVSQALVTTAFGLMVGIPAMMAYAYFRRRASRQVALLEVASTGVLTALMSKHSQ